MSDSVSILGASGRVSLNESWTAAWTTGTPQQLHDAGRLSLGGVPASPSATALNIELTAAVAATETRGNKRLAAGNAKLLQAIGAIIGGILTQWGRAAPRAVYRSVAPSGFTGGLVAHRQFQAAMDGLVRIGMVARKPGVKFAGTDWGDGSGVSFEGQPARYWPTTRLLDLATSHGLSPASLLGDYRSEYSTIVPKVPKIVELVALREPKRGKAGRSPSVPLPIPTDMNARYEAIQAEVMVANAFAAGFKIEGCLPPRWKRIFTATLDLHGRWYAVGNDGRYQRLSKSQRLAIRIGGEPVVEIDIRASHLSILHGMFNLPAPDGDPYNIGGLPRNVVKAWVTGTLGKGTPVTNWSTSVERSVAEHNAREVGAKILEHYPFLSYPSKPLDHLANIGRPSQLVTFALMGREAAALTVAMSALRLQGVLSLPVHDSLIVPELAETVAIETIRSAFREIANTDVRITVERPV